MHLGIFLEAAEDAASDSGGTRLFDATYHHAEVTRLHDDSNALWVEYFLDGVGDLFGEALLNLQPPREHLGYAWEFGEPDDSIGGHVADVHLRWAVSFG